MISALALSVGLAGTANALQAGPSGHKHKMSHSKTWGEDGGERRGHDGDRRHGGEMGGGMGGEGPKGGPSGHGEHEHCGGGEGGHMPPPPPPPSNSNA